METNPINTVRKRRALNQRKEPYWHAIRRGAYVGLYVGKRKSEWRARALGAGKSYFFDTLGDETALSYDDAETKAREFADLVSKTEKPDYAVADAVTDYVDHLRKEKGTKAADDARGRLAKHFLPKFGKRKLTDLRSRELTRWLHSLVPDTDNEREQQRAKSTANRLLNYCKAALNLAFYDGIAPSDGEWRRVKGFPSADAARTLFLTPRQVQDLLRVTEGPFRVLVEAATLTGARYGELAAATVRDLDTRNGSLRLDGKTGARDCYLSAEALTFFRKLSLGKLPHAPLLMREDGSHWKHAQQQKPIKKAIAAAGLPAETVFYSLRHYHVSRALRAGIPAQVIAENCGTSVRMIEKHYGKFMKTDRRRMMDQVTL